MNGLLSGVGEGEGLRPVVGVHVAVEEPAVAPAQERVAAGGVVKAGQDVVERGGGVGAGFDIPGVVAGRGEPALDLSSPKEYVVAGCFTCEIFRTAVFFTSLSMVPR